MTADDSISEAKPEDHQNGKIATDEEGQIEKVTYPKSVFFIVSNEFCERFSFYGMRTILTLYLKNILLYSESDSKIIYHSFTMFVYFFPILGAIISDSYLGKFNTILYVSVIYAAGSIIIATASAPWVLPQKAFTMVGLALVAVGTGGIKPCVSAFGGDQFVLPQQELQLVRFFSLFYFAINSGSLISTFLTPILREDVHCFGNDHCYPLAFAIPGGLMVISIGKAFFIDWTITGNTPDTVNHYVNPLDNIAEKYILIKLLILVIFALGKSLYRIEQPKGNVVVQVSKCIGNAISLKMKRDKTKKAKEHWLDYSTEKYGTQLVNNVKDTLKVLVLYIPLPIFWALYDQQGSAWTLQAARMDGDIGFYTILPDQMQVVNPLLILSFIPLFTYVVYPLLGKINLLKTPLQRMCCGGFLAAAAFALTACVSLALESTDPVLPEAGNIQIRIYNPASCPLKVEVHDEDKSFLTFKAEVPIFDTYTEKNIPYTEDKVISFKISSCTTLKELYTYNISQAHAYGILVNTKGIQIFLDNIEKSEDGKPLLRTIAYNATMEYKYSSSKESLTVQPGNYEMKQLGSGTYTLDKLDKEFKFKLGGVYSVMIDEKDKATLEVEVTEANSIHILWLLPQYFVMTAGEIMFSITGLEFSYSQAPSSMKSVLQASFLLTTAIGNLIIVLIESAKVFDKQSYDFFLYTGLMVVDMLVFAWLAVRYKYVESNKEENEGIEQTVKEESQEMEKNDNSDMQNKESN